MLTSALAEGLPAGGQYGSYQCWAAAYPLPEVRSVTLGSHAAVSVVAYGMGAGGRGGLGGRRGVLRGYSVHSVRVPPVAATVRKLLPSALTA